MNEHPVYCKLTVYNTHRKELMTVRVAADKLNDVCIQLDQGKYRLKRLETFP